MIKQNQFTPCMTTIHEPFTLLERFVKFFDQGIKQKKLNLFIENKINGDPDLVAKIDKQGILLDQMLYQQILYNVFSNACKFNKMGGFIRLRINAYSVAKAANGVSESGEEIILETEIEDEGQGIDQKTLSVIFEVFENIRI